MKFIQTLYIKNHNSAFKNSFGWAAPAYHLMSWALSCLQLKKLYGNVAMYCNSEAVSLLKNQLGLPYDNYYTSHDDLNIPHEKLWALPKVFTYSLQKETFLHLDGDVFLFGRLPEELLNSSLISQNVEEATDYYLKTQNELISNFNYFPNCVKNDFESNMPIEAVNAGILGGSNISFIKEYCEEAFKYINKNISCLSSVNVDLFNVFFEQHLFYSLAKEKRLPVEVLIKETIKDNQYLYLGNFHEVPCKRNYLHLLGQYKRDEQTCRLMAAKLRELYPEYYFRILSLFKKKGIPVLSNLYTENRFNTFGGYTKFINEAKEIYKNDSCTELEKKLKTIPIQKDQITALLILQNIIDGITDFSNFSRKDIEDDFTDFSKNLLEKISHQSNLATTYIYGRDLNSAKWFCELFGDDNAITHKIIVKCNELSVIKSIFDWAGLLNRHLRIGIKYYDVLELKPGEFYNLIIPEIYGDGFSLYDLDEIEKIILEQLSTPVSIKELFIKMHIYVEEDIIENHLEEYEQLIIIMLKQLVIKKAVKPFRANNYTTS